MIKKHYLDINQNKSKVFIIMKLIAFLLLLGTTICSASVKSQEADKVSVNAKNKTIAEVFTQIEQNTGYSIFYSNDIIDTNINVSIKADNKSIEEILNEVLEKTNNTYVISNNQIYISSKGKNEQANSQQESKKTITGIVKDTKGEVLIGVSVMQKGTTIGTMTDINGSYKLSVPEDAVLEFSYVGFMKQEVAVGNKSELDITLVEEESFLDEVIVVGYGTQKKVNLTGSVQNVTSDEISKRNSTNVSNALQGLVPGVSVVQGSGRPGADAATIKIRGTGSINSSSNPLVLIDGVEGDMNYLDANSIESISVLKDAASASIYGSRASNGVILITTKRATDSGLKVSYSGYVGTNSPTEMPKPIGALRYMEKVNEARANADQSPTYNETQIEEMRTLGGDNMNRYDTDWKNLILKNNALVYNNSVTLQGGSKNVRLFGNIGHYYQDGIIANNDYKRTTVRLNSDFILTKWMKAGLDVNIRESKTIRPSLITPENIISRALTFTPVMAGVNADGTIGYGQNGENPYAAATVAGTHTTRQPELGIKGFVSINPFEGLDVTASYSRRKVDTDLNYIILPYDTYEMAEFDEDGNYLGAIFKNIYPASGSEKHEERTQLINNQYNLQATYEKQLSNHYLKVLGGVQAEDLKQKSITAGRLDLDYDGYTDLDHGSKEGQSNSGQHSEWAMLSYYARINYSFKEKYLLELNGRWDGSTRFLKEHRWGFFPSVSAGWRVSEESFFEPLRTAVDNLKIRASYGSFGNQDMGTGTSYYPYATLLGTGYGYWFNKIEGTGVAQTLTDNLLISWEKSKQFNVGLDANILNSRLSFTFDYFIRDITDMLQQFKNPTYMGGQKPAWTNAGDMQNKGWDLSVTWRDRVNDFNYYVTANLSDVKNKVTNLYGNEYINDTRGSIIQEGAPINSWYGFVTDGFYQSQEEIDNGPDPVSGQKKDLKPGYVKYVDMNDDGKITLDDRRIIGDPAPRYEFSLNFGGDWKGIDVAFQFQGVGKRDIHHYAHGARPFYVGRTMFEHQMDTWTEDNRNAEFPLLTIDTGGDNINNRASQIWVKSGAYMRLKNMTVGYTLPKNILNKVKIDKLRFYVNAQNVFTIKSGYEGFDPEANVQAAEFYPLMRTITFGVDIQF